MQETEVKVDYNNELLTFKGFTLHLENNLIKSRCGIYIKNEIKHQRREDLEGVDKGLVILDINLGMQSKEIKNV